MPLSFNAPIGDTRVEEDRLGDAHQQIPACLAAFNDLVGSLAQTLARATTLERAQQACFDHGLALWRSAGQELQRQEVKDDRPLYWARLQMLQQIRQQAFSFGIEEAQRNKLLAALEEASRGRTSATFTQRHSKRILVSGFDPFGFTTNIERNLEGNIEGAKVLVDLSASNPSGAAALELSNTVILHQGRLAEVQSVIFPVRYEDFDLGVVERFFRPYFEASPVEDQWVDMVITISRGRSDFDVERFTGRRRSSKGKDNVDRSIHEAVPLAATPVSTLPLFEGAQLVGPEFLESTLPIAALATMQSHYPVNDNRRVTILNEQGEAEPIDSATLAMLAGKLSLAGSGGGFLSNEISYRTHLLREQSRRSLPIGHLHVPKPESAATAAGSMKNDVSDPQTNQAIIVAQVKELVKAALLCL